MPYPSTQATIKGEFRSEGGNGGRGDEEIHPDP